MTIMKQEIKELEDSQLDKLYEFVIEEKKRREK